MTDAWLGNLEEELLTDRKGSKGGEGGDGTQGGERTD